MIFMLFWKIFCFPVFHFCLLACRKTGKQEFIKMLQTHRNRTRVNWNKVWCDFHKKRIVFLFYFFDSYVAINEKQENIKNYKDSWKQITNDQILNYHNFHANLKDVLFFCFSTLVYCPVEKQKTENRQNPPKSSESHKNQSKNRKNVCFDFHMKKRFSSFLFPGLLVSCCE